MTSILVANLLSPITLAFALGLLARVLRSELRLPEPIYQALGIYLLLALGLHGGIELRHADFGAIAGPAAVTLLLGAVTPLTTFAVLRRLGRFGTDDAAGIAAHYGSVSAVTFIAAQQFVKAMGAPAEGFMTTLLTLLESPGIHIALALGVLARTRGARPAAAAVPSAAPAIALRRAAPSGGAGRPAVEMMGGGTGGALAAATGIGAPQESTGAAAPAAPAANGHGADGHGSLGQVLHEVLTGRTMILLVGGLVMGFAMGDAGWAQIAPFYDGLFKGALTLFILEMGLVAGARLGDLKKVGPFLLGFGIAMPVLHGALGVLLGHWAGLSVGGCTVLGTMAASASYIAAPPAVRLSLPDANPTYSLTLALAITFPFNIVAGIPLYHWMSRLLHGA